ncbi:MAG: hypothetical protein GXZ18_07975 [Synergistaceae bacterium]|nr:hypothetical protein [Synergistaceae bacterium]
MTKFSASETTRLQKAAEEAIDAQMTYQMQRQQELLDLLTKGSLKSQEKKLRKSTKAEPVNQPEEISEDSQEKGMRGGFQMREIREAYPELTDREIRDICLGLLG